MELTQEQELLQGTIRDFSRSQIATLAPKIDFDQKVPDELAKKLPEMGLYGVVIPTEFGGAGADYLSLLLATEELSKVSGTVGARISFHGIVCETLKASLNKELKNAFLPKLSARTLSAFSVDQKSSISWKKNSTSFILDGSSDYVLNADSAGVFLIRAKSKEGEVLVCFDKEEARDSIEIGDPKKLMGMRGSGTSAISLHGLKLPDSSLVFEPGNTPSGVEQLFVAARLGVASQALGIAQASLDEEVRYANERNQFNTKIGQFYAVQDFIAMDEISVDTARSLTYSIFLQSLSEKSTKRRTCIAKVAASNAAVQCARHSIRVHGGYGFVRDYPVERFLRDARATQIFLEPNEVLKAKIAQDLLG